MLDSQQPQYTVLHYVVLGRVKLPVPAVQAPRRQIPWLLRRLLVNGYRSVLSIQLEWGGSG